MAEILAKTSTAPNFEQMRSDIEKRQGTELQAAKDVALAEYEQKGAELGIQAELAGKKAEKQRELRTELQQEISGLEKQMFPAPERKMTQEDATSYAQLASVVATLGLMLGGGAKGSAKVALSAMNGMMKGWQAGRKDLWERESKTFEAELRKMKAQNDDVNRRIERAMKLMPLKRDEALSELEAASYISSQGILPKSLNTGNYKAALSTLQSMNKEFGALQQLQFKHAQEERRHQETLALRRQQIAAAQAKAAAPGRVGQNALTFASRVYGNILNASADLKNLTMLPQTAESPLLSGMINTEPSTALGSIRAFVGREITSPDARAFDQVANSLDAALARLEAQGVASGATQGAIKSFNALKPKAGDPALNMAMYIARVKQEIETGIRVHREMPGATESQKAEAIQELQKINKIIPFSVDDVLSVARSGRGTLNDKMKNLVQKPSVAQGIQYQGLSPLDVDATQQTDKSDLRSKAAARIAAGGDPDAVARRYKELTGEDY